MQALQKVCKGKAEKVSLQTTARKLLYSDGADVTRRDVVVRSRHREDLGRGHGGIGDRKSSVDDSRQP